VEVAVFRSAFEDPQALFVGIKGGYNQVNHGHLDLGSFELDASGVRWARDLGSENYNLPGYWDGKKGGRRWTYFRLGSLSHNVCLLDGEVQDPLGEAKIIHFASRIDGGSAVVDLSSAYRSKAKSAFRGLALLNQRQAVLVQDEFEIGIPCEVAWGMTTDAKIRESPGSVALLSQKGKLLKAFILSPEGAVFSVESAEQKPPQKRNTGVSRLMIRMKNQQDLVRIAVLLAPVDQENQSVDLPRLSPLAEWQD
jgi:hypothetical protein